MKAPRAPKRPRVVVVDDESAVANMLAIVLSQNGFAALAVYSGSSALQVCHTAKPDVLIMDIAMPDMDGIETAARIRELRPGCPILLFTGADIQKYLEQLRREGTRFEVLEKPILPEELVKKAREYVQRTAQGGVTAKKIA